jgi:hypothetical protein
MLDARQAETIAYIGDGEIICRQCAIDNWGALTISKLDEGLWSRADGELSPLSRYDVDTYNSERAGFPNDYGYEIAVADDMTHSVFNESGELIAGPFDCEWAAEEAIYELVRECCGECGEVID